MNKIPNRQVICDVLLEHAKEDRDIAVSYTHLTLPTTPYV